MDALALTVSLHSLTILGMRSPRVVHIFITCLQVDISSWLLEKIVCWGCGQRSLWVNSMWSGKVDQNKSWASSCRHPLELGRDSVVQLAGGVILHVYACASLSRAYTDHRGVLLQSHSPAGCPSALSWSLQGTVSSAVSLSLPYSLILRTSWQLSVFPPVSSHPQVSLGLRGIKSRSVRFCFPQPPKNIMEGDTRRITFPETLLAQSSCNISWIYPCTCQTWFWALLNNPEIHIVYTRKHFILYVWVFHQHVCTRSNLGGQKRVAEPPQLELHVVVS